MEKTLIRSNTECLREKELIECPIMKDYPSSDDFQSSDEFFRPGD